MKPLFNQLISLSKVPYKIVETLAKSSNENLWKALYYPDYDCLSKKNLTFREKMDLIWKNEEDQLSYKIFLKPLVSDELTNAMTQIRINKINISPTDRYESIVLYEFMIIVGERIALIADEDGIPVPRVDYIEQELIKELNGKDIDAGSGFLEFNKELSRNINENLSINNGKTAFGTTLVMGIRITELGENGCGG